MIPSSFIFLLFLMITLAIHGILCFHTKRKLFCSNSVKNAIGNLIGIALNLSEKAMAPHSSTLAWKIPWMEELVGCSPWGRKESDMTERLPFHFSLSCIGEGNGNPLQCSCLEKPRDGEPGGLPSLGSHRVGHDWSDLAVAAHTATLSWSQFQISRDRIKMFQLLYLSLVWSSDQ